MTYDTLIEQTRKELEKYSDNTKALTDLYNKAKENYDKSFNDSIKKLNDDYEKKRNAASAQQKLDEKNAGEYLAARGLAYSGESAQAKLNSDMIYKNTLSSLASDHAENLSKLENSKNSYLAELDLDYAEKLMEKERELTDTAIKLAEDKIKYGDAVIGDPIIEDNTQIDTPSEEDNTVNGNQSNNNSGNSSGNNSSGGTNTNKKPSSGSADKNQQTDKEEEKTEESNTFEPSMTAYQLANAIAKRYGTSDTVTTAEANINISKYLNGLKERYTFADDYMDKVIFVLDALGYTPMDDESIGIATIVSNSADEYNIEYTQAETLAKLLFTNYDDRKEYAEKRATMARLDYIYTRCKDINEFYTACSMLDLSDYQVRDYLRNIEAREGKSNEIQLGGNLINTNNLRGERNWNSQNIYPVSFTF